MLVLRLNRCTIQWKWRRGGRRKGRGEGRVGESWQGGVRQTAEFVLTRSSVQASSLCLPLQLVLCPAPG